MSEMIKVLYVDDEELNLMLFEANFRNTFKVLTAGSGYQGMSRLKANPDTKIVISDMRMPGMNGIEFVRIAKQEFRNVAFFILTGYEKNKEITDALETKLINRCFRKPFEKEEIKTAITSAIPG
jgi:CheY-like chemotaxis protein